MPKPKRRPKIELPEAKMSFREKKLLKVIRRASAPLTTQEMARKAFPQIRPFHRADRAARNNIRRLIVGGYVQRTRLGHYKAVAE